MACLFAKPVTTLADRLKTFRVTAGMTQLEAATKGKMIPAQLGEYEQGKTIPQWPMVLKLVRLYGIRLLDVYNEMSANEKSGLPGDNKRRRG
jgi:transcriptional regulator with XRE-family HTH domain